jgi:cell wall-associated NlpC family hydrolase
MIGRDLPTVGAKIEGEIGDLLAKLKIAQDAVKQFKREAKTSAQLRIAEDMKKELNRTATTLKSGIIRDAMAKALKSDDIAAREGESSAKAFARAWRAQMKKERYRTPGWLPLVGLGLGVAPSALAGATGIVGGLGTAAVGAAAGLGALAASAVEVLAPVKQAFQAIDKLTTSNQVMANATALRTWLGATTTTTSRSTPASSSQIQAARLRVLADQQRIAGFGPGTTQATRTRAQGYLISAQGSLQALLGRGPTTTTTANSLGPGLGFLTNPNVNWYTLNRQQRRNVVLASQNTTGLPSAEKSQLSALMQERQAYIGLDAAQRKALYTYQMFDKAMVGAQDQSQPIVLKLFAQGLAIITPLLKYLHPLAMAAGDALGYLFTSISKITQSGAFKDFMSQLLKMAGVGTKGFGEVLINIGVGLMHIFTAFSKSGLAQDVLDGLVKASQHFANWTGGKGFGKFLNDMKTNAPIVGQLLKNLASVIASLAGSMTGGFGTAELKLLTTFFGIIAWAAKIPGIGSLLYNLIALELVFSKFGSLKATTALWDVAYRSLGRLAGLKLTGLVASMLGLDMEGKTLGEVWKAAGSKVLTGVNTAVSAMGKWVLSAFKAAGRIIAAGATALAGWVASMLGIDAATAASTAFIVGATGGIILAIGLLVLGIYELVKHWKTVWGFIERISMDAWNFIWNGFGKWLLPLLGPAGLIILGVVEVWKHWKTIWGAIESFTKTILKTIVDHFLGWAIDILKAANFAFGWVPALGPKLKGALKDLENFRDSVNRALGGIGSRHINVGVYLSAAKRDTNPITGAQIFHAKGGMISGGTPGRDSVVGVLQPGEVVVPTNMVNSGAVDHLRGSLPGFARGGQVGSTGKRVPGLQLSDSAPNQSQIYSKFDPIIARMAIAFAKSLLTSGGPAIAKYAMSWLGKIPYVWGGSAVPGGADCSGFVQTVYGRYGIGAPRTSEGQGAWVRKSPPVPGGLAFYHSPAGGPDPGHVAIVGFNGKVISQGGGMGPQLMGLHSMPLLWTGVPPRGFPHNSIASAGGGRFSPGFLGRNAAIAEGRALAASMGWSGLQWTDLYNLWQRESGWNSRARNPSSGAAGIPQDITGNFHGGTEGQLRWGLNYIHQRYIAPSNAWLHEEQMGWYSGGTSSASPGWGVVGERGPEFVKFHGGEQVVPMGGGRGRGGPVHITVVTQEIRPQYHAAQLGFELARRVG